jgi:pimeloyl-ACP methyl ester carboxylesterase
VSVPVDYDDPDGPSFDVPITRHLAGDQANRIGTLLVNPGGPGVGGTDMAVFADQAFGAEILERFDIVGWDPRGTATSTPSIDCIDDYDAYFAGPDVTPDDDAERQQLVDVARRLSDRCTTENAAILDHVGTNDTARDMNTIREALGEAQISYLGFSYGSELGATWATMFPETVRAAVLDGASDPHADMVELALQQATGFETALTSYLAQCSSDTSCAFHNGGDAEGAFDALMTELDAAPIPSTLDRPDVTRGVALTAVAEAMYSSAYWVQLSGALASAQLGDGSGLISLWDGYYVRTGIDTWSNATEAMQVIRCMDQVERPTVAEVDADAPRYDEAAPRLGMRVSRTYPCSFFPVPRDPRTPITGRGAGPILVIGTTGDPVTPLAGTRAMAGALEDARLVVVTAAQHTGYGANSCVDDAVSAYLVDLVLPDDDLQC